MHNTPVGELPVGLNWQKAEKSGCSNHCVEVARVPGVGIAVRHSKAPTGTALVFNDLEFGAFLDGASKGEFDHLLGGA